MGASGPKNDKGDGVDLGALGSAMLSVELPGNNDEPADWPPKSAGGFVEDSFADAPKILVGAGAVGSVGCLTPNKRGCGVVDEEAGCCGWNEPKPDAMRGAS